MSSNKSALAYRNPNPPNPSLGYSIMLFPEKRHSSPNPTGTMYIQHLAVDVLLWKPLGRTEQHRQNSLGALTANLLPLPFFIALVSTVLQTLPVFKSSLVDYSMSWRIIRTRRLALDFPWGRRAGRFEHVYTPTHRQMRKARSLSTPRFLVRYLRYGGYIITH